MKVIHASQVAFAVIFSAFLMAATSSCQRDESAAEGSSEGSSSVAPQDPVAQSQAQVAVLEKTIRDLQQQLKGRDEQKQSSESLLQQQLTEKDALIAALKKQSEDSMQALYMYQYSDLLKPPRAKNADVFPIRVHDINYIYVDNTQEGIGKLRFGVRNLTKTDKCVFLSTGKERKRITLASGADETLEMWGKIGKPIKLDVNHLTKNFEIEPAIEPASTSAAAPASAGNAPAKSGPQSQAPL
ncbi:MAG TPA: hypothetical protein DCZ95_09995 [Verrucomicrobia bacterium]|nr:MAG: hypothetical protein A2X46_00215 [Lentisphaerae bacterium GWF2_57_35]HBA84412.1 hypothetical protein [Verrucomicrobiota bacterium]